jgi:hypothetical protein
MAAAHIGEAADLATNEILKSFFVGADLIGGEARSHLCEAHMILGVASDLEPLADLSDLGRSHDRPAFRIGAWDVKCAAQSVSFKQVRDPKV